MDAIAKMPTYEAYKDTGEDWIGVVPSHWPVRKLKHLFREKKHKQNLSLNSGAISFGKVVKKDDEKILESTKASYQEVRAGEFLINPLNLNYDLISLRIALSEIDVVVSAGYIVLQEIESIYKSYFKYLLHRYDVAYMKLLGSGVRQTISFNHISSSLLVLPPSEEQTLIADFLDQKTAQIDEAIAIKEQQIALLKERKQIIIQKAVTQGLNPDVPMKDSGVEWIGEIPAHWETTRVKNLFRLVMEPSEKNNNHELLSVYTDIGVKPRRELEERGNKASTTDGYWFVKKGDIVVNKLLAWMGAIGFSEYDGVTSPAYDILRPKLPVNGYFYHYLFRSEFCSAELKRHSRGIMDMRLRLYFDKFGDVEVPYPPKEEQDRIIEQMESKMTEIDEGLDHLKLQIASLKEYKTTLINSAVTGKIRITPEMVA